MCHPGKISFMRYSGSQDGVKRLLLLNPVHSYRVSGGGGSVRICKEGLTQLNVIWATAATQQDQPARPAANYFQSVRSSRSFFNAV